MDDKDGLKRWIAFFDLTACNLKGLYSVINLD